MAINIVVEENQSMAEKRTYFGDFSNDLPLGVTVLSGVATHIPPTTVPPQVPQIPNVVVNSPHVDCTLAAGLCLGTHLLRVVATFSDTETSEILYTIHVKY